jgi:hypothetical protein
LSISANPGDPCIACNTACNYGNGTEIFPGATSCCKKGNSDGIYSGSTVCTGACLGDSDCSSNQMCCGGSCKTIGVAGGPLCSIDKGIACVPSDVCKSSTCQDSGTCFATCFESPIVGCCKTGADCSGGQICCASHTCGISTCSLDSQCTDPQPSNVCVSAQCNSPGTCSAQCGTKYEPATVGCGTVTYGSYTSCSDSLRCRSKTTPHCDGSGNCITETTTVCDSDCATNCNTCSGGACIESGQSQCNAMSNCVWCPSCGKTGCDTPWCQKDTAPNICNVQCSYC